MNIYKEKYGQKKEAVLSLLNITKEFYDKYDKEHESEIFKNIIKNLENEEFSIVLVGEFSAGKSTFLNALMGEKILPSFTDETTATVNFLRHKEKAENGEAGRVYFKDENGKRVEVLDKVDFDTINKYVCTKSEIGVASSVEHLDLFLDSKFLEGNVTLVDSPGLNGTADGHREITEAQIEKSSASIFMFKADQPGSKTDFEFLRQLKTKVNTIIFVLNKIDDIKTSEGETPESVIESLKNNYKKQFPDEETMPEIWGVSAYQALVARSKQNLDYHDRADYSEDEKSILEEKSRMSAFEDRLWKFLTQGEKARTLLLSPVEKVMGDCSNMKSNMENEIEIIKTKTDASEIEEQIIEVKNQMDNLNSTIKDVNSGISSKLERLIDEIEESVDAKTNRLKEAQIRKLDNWNDIDELIDIENNMLRNSDKEYKKIINKCEKEFTSGMKNIIYDNYAEAVEEINNNLSAAEFDISISAEYEPSESEFKLGIENYENEISRLENELEAHQEKLDKTDMNIIKKRAAELEKQNIEESIRNMQSIKYEYINMTAPSKECVSEKDYDEYSRKGVFGVITNVFVGKKRVETTKTKVVNEDEIREFKAKQQNLINSTDLELTQLKEQLNRLQENGMGSEKIELEKKQILRKQNEIKNKIEEKRKEFKENYIKQNERVLRRKKNEFEDYFDKLSEEYCEKIVDELRSKKKIFMELINSSICNSLNIKLEAKRNECSILENKLKSSQEDKEKYIANLENMIHDIEEILSKAVGIEADIESEDINEIEQITL